MKERFIGTVDAMQRLISAIRDQQVVEHDDQLATFIAENGELVEFGVDEIIVNQDAHDNDIYFLLIGEVRVQVNGQVVATRASRECIGEMAILSPASQRSATVITNKRTLAVKLDDIKFQEMADRFPKLWRPLARTVADRLREREQFHRKSNPSPILFIGSSVEGLPVAREIVSGLKHGPIVARIWSQPGLFSPSGMSIDILLKEVTSVDFAVFVFGPDDKIASRLADYEVPRDNVVFELGLFMGGLARDRAFIVKDQNVDVKIPTDLLGLTPITYKIKPGNHLQKRSNRCVLTLRKL